MGTDQDAPRSAKVTPIASAKSSPASRPQSSAASKPSDGSGASWTFERTNYSPDTIYSQSRDDKGHSNWLRVRLASDIYDQVMAYSGTGNPFGYRSPGEFVRDALIHRMAHISSRYNEWTARFDAFLVDFNIEDRLARSRHRREWTESMVNEVDSISTDLVRRKQVQHALDQLLLVRDEVPDDNEPHHVYIRKYITRKLTELRELLRKENLDS